MSTIVSLLALTAVLQSPAAPPFVNQTFKEILSRVVERDPESGAVMAVRPKADSPGPPEMRMTLEIRRSGLFNGEAAQVTLLAPMKAPRVYEQYVLKVDAAIAEELKRLEKRATLNQRQEDKERAERSARIAKLSAGKLHYGMTLAEVERILGNPLDRSDHQLAGFFDIRYSKWHLQFRGDRLDDLSPIKP